MLLSKALLYFFALLTLAAGSSATRRGLPTEELSLARMSSMALMAERSLRRSEGGGGGCARRLYCVVGKRAAAAAAAAASAAEEEERDG